MNGTNLGSILAKPGVSIILSTYIWILRNAFIVMPKRNYFKLISIIYSLIRFIRVEIVSLSYVILFYFGGNYVENY